MELNEEEIYTPKQLKEICKHPVNRMKLKKYLDEYKRANETLSRTNVLEICLEYFETSLIDLQTKRRKGYIKMVRQIIWYMIHLNNGTLLPINKSSLSTMGEIFNRDHSTALYGINKCKTMLEINDREYCEHIEILKQKLNLK
jgi:chromosomal replication initiation ATPase DnaA